MERKSLEQRRLEKIENLPEDSKEIARRFWKLPEESQETLLEILTRYSGIPLKKSLQLISPEDSSDTLEKLGKDIIQILSEKSIQAYRVSLGIEDLPDCLRDGELTPGSDPWIVFEDNHGNIIGYTQ